MYGADPAAPGPPVRPAPPGWDPPRVRHGSTGHEPPLPRAPTLRRPVVQEAFGPARRPPARQNPGAAPRGATRSASRTSSGAVDPAATDPLEHVRRLVDECRTTCLWYLRPDYQPASVEEALRVLEAIARHGDLEAHRRSSEARRWLSPPSSSPSAV